MKRKLTMVTTICLAALMLVVMCGCGDKDIAKNAAEVIYPADGSIYPMQCEDGLSIYTAYNTDTEKIKYWKEATGVELDFSSSISGGEEALALMIAANDLPDIMLTNLSSQAGGVQKYVDDGVIIDLTEYMDEYAPNFKAWMEKDDQIRKMSLSDDGKNYFFPCIRYENKLRSYRGLVLRKDLLDKFGLSTPETIDEWYNVLKTFKANGVSAPLSYQVESFEPVGGFLTAYNVIPDFYLDNGKVKYGYLEDSMREGLKTMAKWYKEGLLDEDIVNSKNTVDANFLNGKTGATYTTSGGGMGKYLRAGTEQNKDFDLVGVSLPVINKGDKNKFSASVFPVTYDNNGFITSQCRNVELAVRFLDYGYSEEGHMLMNFGKEGVSYEMKDGYPTYTDLVMNNPDGKSVGDAMTDYIFGNWSGPFAQDEAYIEQYNQYPQQKAALTLWGDDLNTESSLPPLTFTTEESNRVTSIMNNVKTCADENLFKFIMGIKSIDKDYDGFIAELKAFGIDEAIEIYNNALKRYNER